MAFLKSQALNIARIVQVLWADVWLTGDLLQRRAKLMAGVQLRKDEIVGNADRMGPSVRLVRVLLEPSSLARMSTH